MEIVSNNNTYSKWIADSVSVFKILHRFRDYLPEQQFDLVKRDNRMLFLPMDTLTPVCGIGEDAFFDYLDKNGKLIVTTPFYDHRSFYWSVEKKGGRYFVSETDFLNNSLIYPAVTTDKHYRMLSWTETVDNREDFYSNPYSAADYSREELVRFLDALKHNYVAFRPYSQAGAYRGMFSLYVLNDGNRTPHITDVRYITAENGSVSEKTVNPSSGRFRSGTETVPGWQDIIKVITEIGAYVSEINLFTVQIYLTENGFMIHSFYLYPQLPEYCSEELSEYYRELQNNATKQNVVFKATNYLYRKSLPVFNKAFRPGMRPYMEKEWVRRVIDDLLHTKGASLKDKIWCWEHGFVSYRLWQYGVNKDNWQDIMSDFQYLWVNRINNEFQILISDKHTTRYVFDRLKEYFPGSYYIIRQSRRRGPMIKGLQELPVGYGETAQDIADLLKDKKLLALKLAYGTHGVGFYRLEYKDGKYFVSGEEKTREEFCAFLLTLPSNYLVTEYLKMHRDLVEIYPKSVNSIRIAVINRHGDDPQIMQTYMRIGAESSGFTDNVGFGGICADVDIETGHCSNAQQITNHVFTDCPVHPDTGVTIERDIPNWEIVKEGVKKIASFIPELEYLGFDVAVTDDGFRIIEINVFQDLHKVAEHSPEFKAYYRDKLQQKADKYGLKKY